jgi:DNA-binding CsgD family transcriptional regulator
MKDIRNLLNIKLLNQSFKALEKIEFCINEGKVIAQTYAKVENCISVLSDLKTRRSYVYYGAIADQLGIEQRDPELNSIWEDNLLNNVNADDLQKKFRLELQFFQLLNSLAPEERSNYEAITRLRLRGPSGNAIILKHRLIYIASAAEGSIRLALCLYHRSYDHPDLAIPDALIVNSRTGDVIDFNRERFENILSAREKDVLQLIGYGRKSTEIAEKLSISINTVNRHRQNILQKLNAANAIEACRIAEASGLLS